ncbi:MAG: hypothetical protein WCF85_22420, partial [Rhodospirillaceae bacterium]
MTSVRDLVVFAGLAMIALAQPAVADGASDSVLRAQSHAIGTAIGTQVHGRLPPAVQADPRGPENDIGSPTT